MNSLLDKESHKFWNTLEPSLKLDGSMNGLAIYWRDSPGFIEELAHALQGTHAKDRYRHWCSDASHPKFELQPQ